jgi:ribosomal protein L37AE/L43A
MIEDEELYEDPRTELDAEYPCPCEKCDGMVYYTYTGYWQCSECSFRSKHIYIKPKLKGWFL